MRKTETDKKFDGTTWKYGKKFWQANSKWVLEYCELIAQRFFGKSELIYKLKLPKRSHRASIKLFETRYLLRNGCSKTELVLILLFYYFCLL